MPTPLRRRSLAVLRALTLTAIVCSGLIACSDELFKSTADCDSSVGVIYIDLQPPLEGHLRSYLLYVGDSIQVAASLRRVTTSEPTLDDQGWSCRTTASTPVDDSITFSTTDTHLIELRPGGWIRALSPGLARVTAQATTRPLSMIFPVISSSRE